MSLTNSENSEKIYDYLVFAKKIDDDQLILVLIFKDDIFYNCFIHDDKKDIVRTNVFTKITGTVIPLRLDLIKKYELEYIKSISIETAGDYDFVFICMKSDNELIIHNHPDWNYDDFTDLIKKRLHEPNKL